MKRIALAATALLVAATVTAQVYEWKDDKGKTHFSDKPPAAGARAQKLSDSPSPAAAATPRDSAADRELDYRKRQKEAQEKSAQTQKEQTAAAEQKEACTSARRLVETLESGERIAARDANGERYYLDDTQRQNEAAKARQIVQSTCTP